MNEENFQIFDAFYLTTEQFKILDEIAKDENIKLKCLIEETIDLGISLLLTDRLLKNKKDLE